jgi:hypothetical protein
MPKVVKKLAVKPPPVVVKCVACGGTGAASNGGGCFPCDAKGWKVMFPTEVKK